MGQVEALSLNSRRRVETYLVNQALRRMVQEHTPALIKGKTKRVKFYFATQVAVEPPTIVVFCNVAREIHESYIRYMTRRFQEFLGFDDIPIRLIFRPKEQVRARAGTSKDEDVDVQESDVTEVEAHVYEGDEFEGEDLEPTSDRDLDSDD
jgi:GTP-binding protein